MDPISVLAVLIRIFLIESVLLESSGRLSGTLNGPRRAQSHVCGDANGFTLSPAPHHSAFVKVWSKIPFKVPLKVFTLRTHQKERQQVCPFSFWWHVALIPHVLSSLCVRFHPTISQHSQFGSHLYCSLFGSFSWPCTEPVSRFWWGRRLGINCIPVVLVVKMQCCDPPFHSLFHLLWHQLLMETCAHVMFVKVPAICAPEHMFINPVLCV